jgi:hypothetical protein
MFAATEILSAALGDLPLAHERASERLDISLGVYHRRFEAAPCFAPVAIFSHESTDNIIVPSNSRERELAAGLIQPP